MSDNLVIAVFAMVLATGLVILASIIGVMLRRLGRGHFSLLPLLAAVFAVSVGVTVWQRDKILLLSRDVILEKMADREGIAARAMQLQALRKTDRDTYLVAVDMVLSDAPDRFERLDAALDALTLQRVLTLDTAMVARYRAVMVDKIRFFASQREDICGDIFAPSLQMVEQQMPTELKMREYLLQLEILNQTAGIMPDTPKAVLVHETCSALADSLAKQPDSRFALTGL